MTSCAQMPLVRGRRHSENLTFSFAVRTNVKRKRASDDETKKPRAPQYSSAQLTAIKREVKWCNQQSLMEKTN